MTREISRTKWQYAAAVAANDMACSPSLTATGETVAARHCTARLRACAYANEISFYLISAAAATLSRRLARATFYTLSFSLAPAAHLSASLSPCLLHAYTHTWSLSLHLLYFVFPPVRLPVTLSSSSTFSPCAPISPLFTLSSFLSYFSLLPYPSFSSILPLFFLNVFPLSLFLQKFPSDPSLFYDAFRGPLVASTSFSRSPQV